METKRMTKEERIELGDKLLTLVDQLREDKQISELHRRQLRSYIKMGKRYNDERD